MRGAVNDATYRLWFERTLPLGLEEGVFVIGVPNDFARATLLALGFARGRDESHLECDEHTLPDRDPAGPVKERAAPNAGGVTNADVFWVPVEDPPLQRDLRPARHPA